MQRLGITTAALLLAAVLRGNEATDFRGLRQRSAVSHRSAFSTAAEEREFEQSELGFQRSVVALSDVHSNMSVSLAIPVVPEDLGTLREVLMPSIREQSLMPSEVIVALSSATPETAEALEADLRDGLPGVKRVKVSLKEGKAYAGENRNRAAGLCTTDLVVFFDSDDAMHPRRVELMAYTFKKYQPKVILAGYSRGAEETKPLSSYFDVIQGKEITERGLDFLGHESWAVHQGEPSVARSVFAQVQESKLPRAQDVRFLNDVIRKYGSHPYPLVYIGLPLSRFSNWRTGR